jgi:mucin-19
MLSSVTRLFSSDRFASKRVSSQPPKARKARRTGRDHSLGVQQLESRLALTIYAGGYAGGGMRDLGGGTFAYNIVIDDTVDGSGLGRDAYIQRGNDGIPYFLLDDNPGFSSPQRLDIGTFATIGDCSTIFVTSGSLHPTSDTLTPAFPGPGAFQSVDLPVARPLGLRGSAGIDVDGIPGIDLSFTYAVESLSASGGSIDATKNSTAKIELFGDWTKAGYGAPTGTVSLFGGGVSSLTFKFVETDGKTTKSVDSMTVSNQPYLHYADPTIAQSSWNPQSFTAFAGQDINQRLIADLAPANSTISLNSPWESDIGAGSDPLYGTYDGATLSGAMSLFASSIEINQASSTTSRLTAGSTAARPSGYSTPTKTLNVNAKYEAKNYAITIYGDAAVPGTPVPHGSLTVSQLGSLTGSGGGSAGSITVTADYTDIRFLGQVSAGSQNYLLRANGSVDQYDFTTRASTGVATGRITGNTVAMTLGQPAGGTVDLQTTVNNLRFNAGTNGADLPYRYTVAIDESDALQVDAVAASSGPISIVSGGDLTVLGSSVRTSGDISLASAGALSVEGDIATGNGTVVLRAPTLSLGSVANAGGTRGLSLQSTTSSTTVNALARAGGDVKQTVRVASVQNVPLTGNSVINGVPLSAGDRVLLKNQTKSGENGIYVYAPAGGGTLARASDADTAAELSPGLVVFVQAGTQIGGWTLVNAATPILGQTGLVFVPASAVRTYDNVKAATTGSITLSGSPQTIDGVSLVVGDRVLVKDQSNAAQNGVYVVSATAWQRASDADTSAELTAGSFVFVQTGGTANGGKGFALSNDAIQVDTTPLSFANFFETPSGSTPWAPARVLADAAVATTVNIALTGLQTIDGIALVAGDPVLVKNQTNASQNGLYLAGNVAWSRATDADATGELPRGTAVYVTGGTLNKNTSWMFNDSVRLLGTTAANSPVVTGLASTTALSVGMLVTAAGIPSGTTISSIIDRTSIRLSANATAGGPLTALSCAKTTPVVVGTDPVVFVPNGGGITITAAQSIGGSSQFQGSTALLTAGTAGAAASNINAQTNVGRVSATSPGPIVLTNATAVELDNVRTTAAGSINATANGTITAIDVNAAGTQATTGGITLTSVFGDVIAESVSTNIGDITLASINGSVSVTSARRVGANVATASGNVTATADSASAKITIDGRVAAQSDGGGAGTGTFSTSSNSGKLISTPNAVIVAADQLRITTPNSVPSIDAASQITAARLSLTSQFGASKSPPAALGTYQTVALNRTDAGDIDYSSASNLVVEGASTANGSISLTAPAVTIKGEILPQGPNADLSLNASASDLIIDAPIGSQRNVTLSATGGKVTATGGAATALITAPTDLTVNASSQASISAKAAGFNAALTDANATLNVTDPDSLQIKSVTLANGGSAAFTIGSVANGGDATVGLISAGATGQVVINAYGNIVDDVDPGTADIIADIVTLNSTAGKIALDTDVNVLTAAIAQKNQQITITDVGTTGLEVKASTGGNNANISVTANGPILATDVVTAGAITLTTTSTADIRVNNVQATGNVVTLAAGGSIVEATPTDPTADIVGATVVLTATGGSINSHVAAGIVNATAKFAGSSIKLRTDNDATLGTIDGRTVSITADGLIQQQAGGSIAADDLAVTSLTGKNITLSQTANNKVGIFAATTVAGASRGDVFLGDSDGGLVLGSITGGTVSIVSKGTGPVTQSGAMDAVNLTVNGEGNAITLDNAGNKIAVFASSNLGGDVYVRDTDADLAIAGITGGRVTVVAANAVTQALPIVATVLEVHGSGTGAITLDKDNTVGSFLSGNGTRSIYFKNTTGLNINGINGGSVILLTAGAVTQAANTAINATALQVHNYATGAVTLNQNNNLGSVTVGNGSGDVYVKDVSGDLDVTGINGGSVILLTAGNVTQQANTAINATALQVHNYAAGAMTLNQKNNVSKLTVGNGTSDVTFNGIGKNLDITGINGGVVTLSGVETVTQSGVINASELKIYSAAGLGEITLDKANNVGGLTVGNGGGAVTFNNAASRVLDIGVINAGNVTLTAAGSITESSPTARINALSLTVSANGPTLSLDKSNNVVTLVSASNPGGNVTFVNAGTFSTGPVTAGTAAVGDGNILLKVSDDVVGDINVNGNLTAIGDQVTLEARKGTFTLGAGVTIDANMLVYYTAVTPTPDPATAPAGTYPQIIASNGDLTIGSLVNPTPITFGGYTTDGNITIIGTSVTITGLLKTTGNGKTIAITATATDVTFSGAGAIENAPAKNGFTTLSATKGTINSTPTTAISGSTASLTVGGPLSFTGPFEATTLSLTGSGSSIALNGSGNKLGSVGVNNGGGSVTINDSTGDLAITGITGGPATITAAGAVTQSGLPIVATALAVNGVGAAITLNGANKIDSFAASNAGGSITITDTTSGLVLNGLEGSTVTIQAPGAITQTKQPIKAAALRVYGSGTGPITLDAANAVSSFLAGNGGEKIALTNSGAGGLDLAGINGGIVDINTKGAVTQSAPINATALTVNAAGNAITLNTQNNAVTSFASSNGAGTIAFKRSGGGLALAGVTGGTVTVDAAGAVTQSAAVNATALTVNAAGNAITLNTQANVLGSFSSSNGTGGITLRDTIGDLTLNTVTSGPLTVVAAGKVLANQVNVTGNATITTANGGGLDVGPLANGLLKSTGQLDLRGVQGQVRLINGGQISGSPILVNSTNPINVGGLITTTPQLNQAVATVNTLPTIVGSTYEIVVGANLVLTQTIVATRPMTLRGTSAAITLSGSATATTGMSIGAGGSGSRVTSLAFSGFTSTGIQLSNAQNVAVSGVTVNSSGYGLWVAGTSTGSTVRGSTFNSCPNAIVLSSATGVTIGGTAAGQPNRIVSSARAGVFATGFCTGSSVIRTSFANTPVRYKTSGSRNLRIVQ